MVLFLFSWLRFYQPLSYGDISWRWWGYNLPTKSGIGLLAENKVIVILSNYLHKHIDKQHKKIDSTKKDLAIKNGGWKVIKVEIAFWQSKVSGFTNTHLGNFLMTSLRPHWNHSSDSGNHSQMAELFRLVNYNLPRHITIVLVSQLKHCAFCIPITDFTKLDLTQTWGCSHHNLGEYGGSTVSWDSRQHFYKWCRIMGLSNSTSSFTAPIN